MRILYLAIYLFILAVPAKAQDRISSGEVITPSKERVCKRVYEMILPLRLPTFSAPVEWRVLPGREGMNRISAIFPARGEEYDFIAIGQHRNTLRGDVEPALLRYGYRRDGYSAWRKREEMADLVAVEKAVATDKGGVAAATIDDDKARKAIKLIFMDNKGEIKDTHTIRDAERSLRVRDMIAAAGDKGGFYLLAQADFPDQAEREKTPDTDKPAKIGRLYRLDKNGKVTWQRGYSAGTNSRLNTIAHIRENVYIVAGRSRRSGGGYAGWALSLDARGAVRWQKSYPRGRGSMFETAHDAPGGRIVLTGRARPNNADGQAGWVLYIDNEGLDLWQRFYTGAYNYKGIDLHVGEDGRIFAFFNATPAEDKGRQFVRVLGLNVYGYLLSDHAYIDGAHANMRGMLRIDNGRTLIFGAAQTGFVKPGASDAEIANAYDAWLIAQPAPKPYKSPCFKKNEQ